MTELLQKTYFAFYCAAAGAALAGFLFNRAWKFKGAVFALAAGWMFNTAYIGLRWYLAERAPLANQYESLIYMVWSFVAVYLLFLRSSVRGLEWLAPWTAALAALSTAGAAFLNSEISPLMPALQSDWLFIHVSTVMAGYGAFTLAFLLAVLYLVMRAPAHEDRRKVTGPLLYRAALTGFWLLSVGIVTGSVWANSAWGSYWSWDPKETWSLITWLYYAMALHLRKNKGWANKNFAWLTASGFVLVLFTYFGVNYLMSGLHSYG